VSDEEEDAPPAYNLEKIKIEEDFSVQKAHLGTWSATVSSVKEGQSYTFVIMQPVDYIDYKQRYLV